MKTKDKMTLQWIIFSIVTLILGPEPAASAQEKNQVSLEYWENPELIRRLFSHPYEPFPFETFPGCQNFSLQENTIPDISDIKTLGRGESFSGVDDRHQELLRKLVNILGDPNDRKRLANAVHIRDQVNPQLYQRALKFVYVYNKSRGQVYEKCRNTNKKFERREWDVNYLIQFPMKFVDRDVLSSIRDNPVLEPDRLCRQMTFNNTNDDEQKLWYFRDDFGLNAHHDTWHAIYPKNITEDLPHRKSRRGELFYYAHSQLLARYNFERLTNGLDKTLPLYIEEGKSIPEGYSNNLNASDTNAFPTREANTELGDFFVCDNHLGTNESQCKDYKKLYKISDFKDWTRNISDAIEQNSFFYENGTKVEIPTAEAFIDILVDVVESTYSTPNRKRYGNMHNLGHQAVAVAHNKEKNKVITDVQGVMTDLAAAVRDPVFYRWHTRLEELYVQHKDKLPPYTNAQLEFDGVKINSVKVKTKYNNAPPNEFWTYMTSSLLNISEGVRSDGSGNISVCYDHLQHHQFAYTIEVESNRHVDGIVRIFMAPKNDKNGKALNFTQQRRLFFELDTFPHKLTTGKNIITRNSEDSSVTTTTEISFGRQPFKGERPRNKSKKFVPDECGWPDNLLIPKGTPEGLNTSLFVIITDWEEDRVDNMTMQQIECVAGVSICGFAENGTYPFKRPMGFPFDRRRQEISITEFSSHRNMHVIDTKIRHTDYKVPGKEPVGPIPIPKWE